jgi:IS5 family transposase
VGVRSTTETNLFAKSEAPLLYLSLQRRILRESTIVDGSIIAAPTSANNVDGVRRPEMHQAKKSNDWHFGMKMYNGVDDEFIA